MKARDLFGEPIDDKKNPFKQPHKRNVVLTDGQKKAIDRDKTIKYFEEQWEKKYGLPYCLPPRSYGYVQMPIEDAIGKGYSYSMLCGGINRYLDDEFKGYQEQKHPIAFFARDIPKWVGLGNERTNRQNQERVTAETAKVSEEQIRSMNEKYGILRKGDGWLTEDGQYFTELPKAIQHATKGNKI